MTAAASRHLALVGPTASGKSALALALARAVGDAEVVSLDSMQVYRGLDVGTAKPTPAEQSEVPHHLLDVAEPHEEWSAVRTQRLATAALAEIEARGRRAILVGGTGLYVRAVVDGLAFAGRDAEVRADLEAATRAPEGLRAAYEELARADPDAAARIDPRNRRRVVRALEVVRSTGRPFSASGPGLDRFGRPAVPVGLVGLWLPRAVVAARIDRRLDAMARGGLVEEARRLAARPEGMSRTASEAIGYREVLRHLSGEEPSLDRALSEAARRTRAFARRQRMWFRRDPRIVWLGTRDDPAALLPAMLRIWAPTAVTRA